MMAQSRKIGLVGLPYDANSSFMPGPRLAPARIREALHSTSWNLTTERGVDLGACGWTDHGDLRLEEMTATDARDAIEAKIAEIIDRGGSVMALGGDHSVSFPSIKAHAERYPGLNVLHLDAHPDLYHSLLDNPLSHASPFARAMETGLVKRLVQVGIRTLNAHQTAQAEKFGVEIVTMADFGADTRIAFDGPVYLSLDLDVLDPAFAPGVSHFEPGGLSSREVIRIIHGFKGKLVGADVVELNPYRDPIGMTAAVAGKMVKELMGRMTEDGALQATAAAGLPETGRNQA